VAGSSSDAAQPDGSPVLRAAARFLNSLSDSRAIGVAISGGSDSTGLLSALCRSAGHGRIVALTVDHGLRPQSGAEAKHVAGLAERLGARHETLHWLGAKPKTGIQAAARQARYALLSGAARRLDLCAIVTAHTAGDQAETLAMRQARSSEGEGLTGIPPATLYDEAVWFLRPFLHLSRAAIRAHLSASGLGWIDDPSNGDRRFERVRLREAGVAAENLTARWRSRTQRAAEAGEAIGARAVRDEDDLFRFDLSGLDRDLALDCLRSLIDMAGGRARGLDRHGRERLGELLDGSDVGRLTVGRVLIQHRGSDIALRRERRNVAEISIEPGRRILWDGRYRIENRDPVECLSIAGGGRYGISPELVRKGDGSGAPEIARSCGRLSRLMPVFEAARADALGGLAGRMRFPRCPWRDWMAVGEPI